jgi:hypothetical protein
LDLESRVEKDRKDGFKSEGERRIGEFMDSYGIQYRYEQGVLVEDRGKPKIWHPDYFLPEFAVYIEYFGLAGNREYDNNIKRKKSIYSAMGLDVIPVYPWTFCDDWQGYIMDSILGVLNRRIKVYSEKQYKNPRPTLVYHNNIQRGSFGGYSRPGTGRYR